MWLICRVTRRSKKTDKSVRYRNKLRSVISVTINIGEDEVVVETKVARDNKIWKKRNRKNNIRYGSKKKIKWSVK